jgi:hypothetical protein
VANAIRIEGSGKVGNTVEIIGSPSITGQFNYTEPNGNVITFYGWTFPVIVNGEAGVYTVWIDSDTAESSAADQVIDDLEADPGAMGGIAENDPGEDPGDPGADLGEPDGDLGDDDGDMVAGDGGGGDVGESV